MPVGQRHGPSCFRNCQSQRGIETQRVGVVLVAPALAIQHQHGAQQFRQLVVDVVLRTAVGESRDEPVDDAALFEHLPKQY